MKSRTAVTLLATAVVLATVHFFVRHAGPASPEQSAAHPPAVPAASSQPQKTTSPGRPDPDLLTPEKERAATLLARQFIAEVARVQDQPVISLDFGPDFYLSLARLDPAQHRLFMTTLLGDASLKPEIRAEFGSTISLDWMVAHFEALGRTACTSALATLDLGLASLHDPDASAVLTLHSLDFVAVEFPDLAARWAADHIEIWDRPGQTPGPEGYRAHLLEQMAAHPAQALAQIDVLAPDDRGAMYTAIAKGNMRGGIQELGEVLTAFQDAIQTAPDPDTASVMHQSLLAGLAQRLPAMKSGEAIAWLDQAQLSPADQQALVDHLEFPPFATGLTPWLTWMDGKLPAAAMQEKLATLAGQAAPQFPGPAVEWISALPEGPARDAAVHSFAERVTDPAAAARLAAALPENHPDRPALLKLSPSAAVTPPPGK